MGKGGRGGGGGRHPVCVTCPNKPGKCFSADLKENVRFRFP